MLRNLFSLIMLLMIFSSITAYSISYSSNRQLDRLDLDGLKHFLESQYIPEIGLLRASTRIKPDNTTIYIANDNVLAARALAILGDHSLASKILTKLNNEYGGGWNGKIDVLLGKDIPDKFYGPLYEFITNITVNNITYTIIYEKLNYSAPIHDWYNYADLLVYHALDELLSGSRTEAENSFLNLTKMWNGYGFRDIAFKGEYQVYKCALFIYLYRALEYAGSDIIKGYKGVYDKCLEIIAKAQDPVKGGIYTSYKVVDGKITILKDNAHDMNTETTSIVVLALYSNYPEIIGSKAKQELSHELTNNPSYYYIMVLVLIVILVLIVSTITNKHFFETTRQK
jgi:hypothetical protein